MGIQFNSNLVSGVRVNDGSTVTPAQIYTLSNTYYRYSGGDYPSAGTASAPYCWHCPSAYISQQYMYTSKREPDEGDSVYYTDGSWCTIVESYTPAAPGYVDCFAVTFNGQGVWAVARKMYLDYNTGMINDVTVSVTNKGYNPEQVIGVLPQTYDSSKQMYYVTVYPGDWLNISATPSAGHRITGGTGARYVTVENTDFTVTIRATYERLEITGSLYDMYNSEQILETIEIFSVTNYFNTSATISSISGCKIYVLDAPYTIAAGQTVSFQAKKNAAQVPITASYQITVNSTKGSFTGWIESSHN